MTKATGLLIGAAATLLGALLGAAGALDRFEAIAWDWRAGLFAEIAPADVGIALVLIDDESIRHVSKVHGPGWPWPREFHASILDYLRRDGARAIAFDLTFDEPSTYGVDDDAALKAVIEKTPRFVMPVRLKEGVAQHSCPDVVGGIEVELGHVVAEPTVDGVARFVRAYREEFAQLGLALCAVGGQTTDYDGDLWLRYRQPRDDGHLYDATPASFILHRVANGLPTDGRFRDRYVLVGVSAENLFDNWPTPVNATAPGVEVHATVVDNVLHDRFLGPAPRALVIVMTLCLCVFGAVCILRGASARLNLAGALLLAPLPVIASALAYRFGWAWPLAWPTTALGVALLGAGSLHYATVGRRRRYVRRAFEHYLSPAVIARIIDDPANLELGGERRELSIFFSDLQGFSTISEGMEPQDLAQLLNDYLSDMTEIILDEQGTLDKYEGDAIIAFWNAPSDQDDHPLRAVRAGLRCQRKLAERRTEFRERTGHELHMRIGVHTGDVSVGNFGSQSRFDYTIIGDAANLAARLEGANKAFGTFFMVSGATWDRVDDEITGRAIARIRVVGRDTPVRVYEPTGFASEEASDAMARFEAARAACESADWKRAAAALDACVDDPLAAVYAARVRELDEAGATAWNDTWNLTSK